MRESSTTNTPLPPSIEKAYHQKCIDLKRRLKEVETANDEARLRKRRLDRSIMKMRMERAFLLEHLSKIQSSLGEDSEEESPPASPELPRRRPVDGANTSVAPQQPFPSTRIDRRAPPDIPSTEALPHINFLPSHTNVIIVNGEPKHPPWTIKDIAPRHHLISGFDALPAEEQRRQVESVGYLPYDIHGNPVLLRQYVNRFGERRWKQLFRDDPEWEDPVVNNVRTDDPFRQHLEEAEKRREEAAVELERAAAVPSTTDRPRPGRPSTAHHARRDSGKRDSRTRADSAGVNGADPAPNNSPAVPGAAAAGFTAVNRG